MNGNKTHIACFAILGQFGKRGQNCTDSACDFKSLDVNKALGSAMIIIGNSMVKIKSCVGFPFNIKTDAGLWSDMNKKSNSAVIKKKMKCRVPF